MTTNWRYLHDKPEKDGVYLIWYGSFPCLSIFKRGKWCSKDLQIRAGNRDRKVVWTEITPPFPSRQSAKND